MPYCIGYGEHPTIYGNVSNMELFSLYRESAWSQMDESDRQQLLQETVNRSAAAKGELGACEVRFADLDSHTLGRQAGNVIEVNRSVFAHDTYMHNYNGHIIEEKAVDSNMRALETVLHEDIHAWQNQCRDGTIQCTDLTLLSEYKANDFIVSLVPDENGGTRPGSHYLNGVTEGTGYYMYYFQSTERDAHLYSERKTVQIMNWLQEKYGTDKSFLTYQKNVLLGGYEATYRKGRSVFGNANFDKEINQVLSNQYYGTTVSVNIRIQAEVQKEMAASYENQTHLSTESKGKVSMDRSFKPVTMEEYDRSMRATVNAFYEHAMNDPSMSHEEAIALTSQMAENYLNTMDELQEAHEKGEIASENDTAAAASASKIEAEAVDDGLSANEDGLLEDGPGDDGGAENDGGLGDDGGIE